jgi:hypothetical protein
MKRFDERLDSINADAVLPVAVFFEVRAYDGGLGVLH